MNGNTGNESASEKPGRSACGRSFWRRHVFAVVASVMLLGLGGGLCVLVQKAREAALAARAQCPLNQLQLALRNYHDMYGCFPPAYVADPQGRPMHSWRVLLLPFIEQRELYESYRFDEPWNGRHNVQLTNRMPHIFHLPSEPESRFCTNIVAIVGPGTAFPGAQSTCLEDFTDGLDNTILLAEIAASDIPWLEPRDLDVREMSFVVNDRSKPSISSSRRIGP